MNILFATDGTKYSECALETISRFNLDFGDELKVITIVDMALPLAVDIYAGYLPSTAEIERNSKENAERIVAATKERIQSMFPGKNFKLTAEILIGSPENKIVEAANLMKADLVIVGSHGYNRLERILLGSVSDAVVHHAPCSVLVIRTLKA